MSPHEPATEATGVHTALGAAHDDAVLLRDLRAIKVIVGADGIDSRETEGLRARMRAAHVSAAIQAQVDAFDIEGVALEDLLPRDPPASGHARVLLYNAILTAYADDVYAPEERALVARAAELMGVSAAVRAGLEDVVVLERAVASLRNALLGPLK